MNNIGSKIRKIREDHGITQDFMALELNISQSNYGRLEKDDNRLTVPKLLKIAKVLDIPVSYLFDKKATNLIRYKKEINAHGLKDNIYSYPEHIKSLKQEIVFLRKLLDEIVKK